MNFIGNEALVKQLENTLHRAMVGGSLSLFRYGSQMCPKVFV